MPLKQTDRIEKGNKFMGRPDTLTKAYMGRSGIFADVFNQFLYQGKQVILPEKLTELDMTKIVVPYGEEGAPVPE